MTDLVIESGATSGMTELPFWLQAVDPDPALDYSGQDDRTIITALMTEGVLTDASFKVTQRAAGANLSVDIAAGLGAITGDSVSDQGRYLIESTGVVNTGGAGNITVPGSGTRIHRVIARVRDKAAAGSDYDWTFEVLEDTGSGTPALPASAISLARITVTSAAGSITDSMIADDRPWAASALSASNSVGGKLSGSSSIFTLTTALGGAEQLLGVSSGLQLLKAGQLYDLKGQVGCAINGDFGQRVRLRIRKTNLAGAEMAFNIVHGINDGGTDRFYRNLSGLYAPAANELATFVMTVQRINGTNEWLFWKDTANTSQTYCYAHNIGAAANIPG